jgi:hypothetical protein
MTGRLDLFPDTPFSFGPRFLHDHAGHIVTDPRIALVELVANSYDAGASLISVQWPDNLGDTLQVLDNGTGMTTEEFNRRWKTLSYNRFQEQGSYVDYPPDLKGAKRIAFGQNGKGRYGPFCFADVYEVETWRDGVSILVRVSLTSGGREPFHCELLSKGEKDGHGTCVRAKVQRNRVPVAAICETIGSKFLVDPFFSVIVNGHQLELLSLTGVATSAIPVDPHGEVRIHQIDALVQDRTTLLRGITWWVNRRMVGTPSWDGLDGRGAILDGRTALAKRCSFVVEVDFLKGDVKDDWTGFHDTARALDTREAVRNWVIDALDKLSAESRKERKREALAQTRGVLGTLPALSKRLVGQFIDEVQQKCPTLSQSDFARMVTIFTKFEAARSGYELLEKLAACSPDDLDTWNRLMEEWSASNAEIVLSELKRRLDLVERLQQLVNVATTDELHELQPLFARGLWIFGPEYESVEFTSNRAMGTVIRSLLGGGADEFSRRRPDVVALADRSICCYAADRFDENGEVAGVRKVLVVELKKGGSTLRTTELRQGEDYALELQKANLVGKDTEVVVFVLGARVSDDAIEERTVGKAVKIIPMMYETILKRAHARTFNLQRRLHAVQPVLYEDKDVEAVLAMPLFQAAQANRADQATVRAQA